jgi:hypothetical protein
MVRVPDLPSSPGGSTGRQAAGCAVAPSQPAWYVHRLLLGQGLTWLVLAIVWLAMWIGSFPHDPAPAGVGPGIFWAILDLLATAISASIGAAEIGMACRLRGGPKAVLAIAAMVQRAMLAAALILAALLVMVGGSILELMALGGLPSSVF